MSADAAAAATTTADAGLPSAYAIGGSASDGERPTERDVLRQPDDGDEDARAPAARASGVSTANTPHAVATPLPPRNRSQTG